MTGSRFPWWAIVVASLAGIGFTASQIVERITVLKDPTAALLCDVNSVVSCSTVLAAWQSSVILGIPNAFIGAVMFAIFLTAGGAVLLGTTPSRAFLRVLLGLAVFFALFATWFMMQTAFAIGALCLWCTGIITAVGVVGASLTRVLAGGAPAGSRSGIADRSGIPLMAWAGWWVVVLALVAVGLYS